VFQGRAGDVLGDGSLRKRALALEVADGDLKGDGKVYEMVNVAPQGDSISDGADSHRPEARERRARAADMRELQGRTALRSVGERSRQSELKRWVKMMIWIFSSSRIVPSTTDIYYDVLVIFACYCHHLLYTIRQISSIKHSFTIVTRTATIAVR